jgi:hypothetical protein
MRNTTSDEYSTPPAPVSTRTCWRDHRRGSPPDVEVERVSLLGVHVGVRAFLDAAEHERRVSAGLGAVTDPALLDRLMDFPLAVPVADAVAWAELMDQLPAVVGRAGDGFTVTRILQPPLTISEVVLTAAGGRELAAVQAASMFAGFARRWVVLTRSSVPDEVVLEAKLCGVGVVDQHGMVLLAGQHPVSPTIDGWTWLLQEKTYRRWLSEQSRGRGPGTPARATGKATAAQGC